MPKIEGYTFVMDLQDRGVIRGLRGMKDAMRILKTEMRSGFSELKTAEGSLSAYNFKVKESAQIIKQYESNIGELTKVFNDYKGHLTSLQETEKEAKAKLDSLKESTTASAKEIRDAGNEWKKARNAVNSFTKKTEQQKMTLDKTKAALASMRSQQEKAIQVVARLKTGLSAYRTETESVRRVTKSYAEALKQSGNYFKANQARVKGLKVEQKGLAQQYQAEKTVLSQLAAQQQKLNSSYAKEKAEMDRSARAIRSRRTELKQAIAAGDKNTASAKRAQAALEKETNIYNRQKRIIANLPEKIANLNKEYAQQAVKTNQAASRLGKLNTQLGKTKFGYAKAKLRGFNTALGQMSAKFKESTSHTRAWASSLKSDFMMASAGVGILGAGVGKATSMAATMQGKWVNIQNLLVTGGEKATEVTKNLAAMQKDASKYSREYGIAQKDIADQYTNLVKRGYTSKAALGAMKTELEATRATGDDFEDVVNNASSALDAFGLRTDNAGKMARNTSRVVNSMAVAADLSATDFKDLGEGMSYVSATASQAGQNVEGTAAALGTLSNSGVEGTRAFVDNSIYYLETWAA